MIRPSEKTEDSGGWIHLLKKIICQKFIIIIFNSFYYPYVEMMIRRSIIRNFKLNQGCANTHQ